MADLKLKFKMPDDESLANYISIKGEKGERGDPTKTSQLTNDSDFTTNAALNSGLATKADVTTVQGLTSQVATNTSALNEIARNRINFVTNAGIGCWYKIATFLEQDSTSNDASLGIHGKIGATSSAGMGQIDITLMNRQGGFQARGEYFMSYWDGYDERTDIVAYQDANDGTVAVYLYCVSWANIALLLAPYRLNIEYDGTYTSTEPTGEKIWSLSTDSNIQKNRNGTISADIDGDAATVNGHTVDIDVPYNALFTDTIYDDSYIQSELDTKVSSSDVASNYATKSELSANVTSLSSQISALASGAPLAVSSVSEMTDTTKIYVNTTDGKWYYYNGTNFVAGGTYQATTLADGSINARLIKDIKMANPKMLNMIDYRSLSLGYISPSNSGIFVPDQVASNGLKYATDYYIPIEAGHTYYLKGALYNACYYDANFNYISHSHQSLVPPTGAVYARYSFGYKSSSDHTYDPTGIQVVYDNSWDVSGYTLPYIGETDWLKDPTYAQINVQGQSNAQLPILSIDWTNSKIILKDIRGAWIQSNYERTRLFYEATAFADYELVDFSNRSNGFIVYNRTTGEISTTSVQTFFNISNEYYYIGWYNTTKHLCVINGIGSYNREYNHGKVVFVPTDEERQNITYYEGHVKFPAGTFYYIDELGCKVTRGSAKPATTYSLTANGITDSKLMWNFDTDEVTLEALNSNPSNNTHNFILLEYANNVLVGGMLYGQVNFGDSNILLNTIIDELPDILAAQNIDNFADLTKIGDKYYAFTSNPDDYHVSYSNGYIYTFDDSTNTLTKIGTFTQNLGHCNTMDYNEKNNCLITGYSRLSKQEFYILEDADSYVDEATWEFSNCIKYDLLADGFDIGNQVNPVWLPSLDDDLIALSSVNGNIREIRKIKLGKGDNQLDKGTFISGTTGFNGTYKVLEIYYTTAIISSAYQDQNQGSQFYKGKIWEGVGHYGIWVRNLALTNNKVKSESFNELVRDASGNILTSYTEGCCITPSGKLITTIHQNSTNLHKALVLSI